MCSCVSVFAALMIQICVENRRKLIEASKLQQEASQLDHSSGDGLVRTEQGRMVLEKND